MQNLPVISIVGRPNVGKSTLFNCITKTKDALVVDLAGTTRDRKYGEGKIGDRPYIVIDTGGIGEESSNIDKLMSEQSWFAIEESDLVLFVVDAKAGSTLQDKDIAKKLHKLNKNIILVINKIDGADENLVASEFCKLGFSTTYTTAASHNRGIKHLASAYLDMLGFNLSNDSSENNNIDIDSDNNAEILSQELPQQSSLESQEYSSENATEVTTDTNTNVAKSRAIIEEERIAAMVAKYGIKVAVVGKPNVGKSTLINKILGESRVVAADMPGTTRESIYIPFTRKNKKYTLIDTAGVRRKAKITAAIEKFSIVKTLQAIEDANVCVLIIDAVSGIAKQDLSLLDFIIESGRALVIAFNKWDSISLEQKEAIKKTLSYKINFANFAKMHFISALHGTGVGNLFLSINKAYSSATKRYSTSKLTDTLLGLVAKNPPPMSHGNRIKLRYAHAGGYNPPRIIIHGNQTSALPANYIKYLINNFQELLKIEGTPIKLEFKTGENPYAGKVNKLTLSQERKRKRLIKFVKKRDKKK